MNKYLPGAYVEEVQRLALGLEVIDAERRGRVAPLISVALDGVPLLQPRSRGPRQIGGLRIDDVLRRVDRHESCRFALVYTKGLYRDKKKAVDLRFLSQDRRFVPRRLTIPLTDPALIEKADTPDLVAGDPALLGPNRARTVLLFPGAAYDVGSNMTGLRGRVRSADNKPVRWVRVEARLQRGRDGSPGLPVGLAQGDDRGEFLLLISSEASPIGPLPKALTLPLEITVWAAAGPPSATDFVKQNDPLWDLPLEVVTGTGPTDPVALGEQLPPTYTVSRTQTIPFELGRFMTSEIPPFIF
jgi:hypothetical protein